MHSTLRLGPRNKRRLAHAGIALGVAVIVVGGIALLRSSHQPSTASHRPYPASGRFAIFSGMSQVDVLQRAGRPTTRRGSCWQYDTRRPIQYRTRTGPREGLLTAVKVCFFAQAVYDVRYQIDGKWPPSPRTHT